MAPKTFRGTFVIDEGQAGLTDEATTRVQDAATRWIEMNVRTARNEAGFVLASQRVRDFLLPALGTTSIGSLTGDDIRGYRLWIERTKRVAPQTVAHLLADLRCMLNWAVDGGLIEHSPFPRRAVPRIQEVAPCRLSDDEVEALVHLPEHYGFIARLGIGTGLRVGSLWTKWTQAGDPNSRRAWTSCLGRLQGNGDNVFPNHLGGAAERGPDVLDRQLRICGRDVVFRHSGRQVVDNQRHADPRPAHAGFPEANGRDARPPENHQEKHAICFPEPVTFHQ